MRLRIEPTTSADGRRRCTFVRGLGGPKASACGCAIVLGALLSLVRVRLE